MGGCARCTEQEICSHLALFVWVLSPVRETTTVTVCIIHYRQVSWEPWVVYPGLCSGTQHAHFTLNLATGKEEKNALARLILLTRVSGTIWIQHWGKMLVCVIKCKFFRKQNTFAGEMSQIHFFLIPGENVSINPESQLEYSCFVTQPLDSCTDFLMTRGQWLVTVWKLVASIFKLAAWVRVSPKRLLEANGTWDSTGFWWPQLPLV